MDADIKNNELWFYLSSIIICILSFYLCYTSIEGDKKEIIRIKREAEQKEIIEEQKIEIKQKNEIIKEQKRIIDKIISEVRIEKRRI